jgi:WbqC-like protein family
MRIAIIQSCYVPWKGFFDLIGRCDEYVIFDRTQFVKRHWHNRNRIKTASGVQWLSIPVISKGRYQQPIDEVEVEKPWAEKHWRAIELAYRRAPFFPALEASVHSWYEQAEREPRLSGVNRIFIREIANLLGLRTRIVPDTSYPTEGAKSERLVAMVRAAGGNRYLSGPSARAYLDERLFSSAGIAVEWMSYDGYPEYPQLHGTFEHTVSILDLLFHTGPDAQRYALRGPTVAAQP